MARLRELRKVARPSRFELVTSAFVAPDNGRNAAMELAHQILQLGELGNRDKGTTVNFIVLKSGDRKNVIGAKRAFPTADD